MKNFSNILTFISLSQFLFQADSFAPVRSSSRTLNTNIGDLRRDTFLNAAKIDSSSEEGDGDLFNNKIPSSSMSTRKEFIVTAGLLSSIMNQPALADDSDSSLTSSPAEGEITGPITIIGSNGKTGSECVGACLSRSIPVRATSRSGVYSGIYANEATKLLSTMPCDVTIPSTIKSAVEGSRAVVFAASASKEGGTPAAVDNAGLVSVAQACIDAKVPSLVIVSSGAVTKPSSPVYLFLNLFGKIMEEKIRGEDAVRALYKSQDSSCTYTVIRPGGLTEEEATGVSTLELNQGDTKSGRIARADVAALCIEASLYPKLTGGTTFECYATDTAKPLASVGMSNIMKQKNKADNVVFMSGKERNGDTFEKILDRKSVV